MKFINCFAGVLLFSISIVSCKRNVLDPAFKGKNQLIIGGDYFQNSAADSIIYSFAEFESNVKEGDIIVNARITGEIGIKDREFQLEVVGESSTALPEEYVLPTSMVVPAGAATASVKIHVKRTPRLATSLAKLLVRVKSNDNFDPGPRTPVNSLPGGTFNINYGPVFMFYWTDVLTKPPLWDASGTGAAFAFGVWSKVKHQLIIDVTGVRSFMSATAPQKHAMAAVTNNYLVNYNLANPGNPLKNENGIIISVCGSCP